MPVVDDKRSAIMHHKFLVVDGQAVWTGSTNLTPTSLYAHNNNALILQSAELADAYTTEFERLFVKKEFGASLRQDVKPVKPINGSMAPTDRFRAAVQDAKVGPDKDIPHITPQIIAKYVSDLRLLGLL